MTSSTFIHDQLKPICPDDIKDVLEDYALKKMHRHRSTSLSIFTLQAFCQSLEEKEPLNPRQLYFLAKELYHIDEIKDVSTRTFSACQPLFRKMGRLVDYSQFYDLETFEVIAKRPELIGYFEFIKDKFRLEYENLSSLIRKYPESLHYIAADPNATVTALNIDYCEKMRGDYRFLTNACRAVDALNTEDEIIYHKIAYKYRLKSNLMFEGTTVRDNSLNVDYKAKLDSTWNIDFIFANAQYADIIANIFIMLHRGKIGRAQQDEAEEYIREIKDPTGEKFCALENAFKQLTEECRFNKDNAQLIIDEVYSLLDSELSQTVVPDLTDLTHLNLENQNAVTVSAKPY